jgi:8-oxo-dGTP pyrophosphatase MutT (NUDIX family)
VSPLPSRDFTATTFIVFNNKTLLLWHRKVQAWLPPGGHIHPDELPEEAARREVLEETGLDVELSGSQEQWGQVTVLHTPYCILLEDIEEGHQHIDLIYFAHAPGRPVKLNRREARSFRWLSSEQLEAPEIAEDIRRLGQQAISALSAGPSTV